MVAQLHLPPYPLHPSVKDRLHPDYVAFYNKYLLNTQQVHYLSLEAARAFKGIPASNSEPLSVGKIQDLHISRHETNGPNVPIRCFTPAGIAPRGGWPVVLYYHGGGWVFGDIGTENTVCTHICVRSKAVVITTDYRLAPEAPWPAAIHDSWEAFLWTTSQGQTRLNLDLSKVGIAGASAGANIAAVVAQKAVALKRQGVTLRSQVLVVPVTDNTATPSNCPASSSWKTMEFTAHLPADKMLWYRHHYLPRQADRADPEASPLLASNELFKHLPPTTIIVGELDVVRSDGEGYARRLEENGVDTDLTVMVGMPHPFIAMDTVLEAGKTGITHVSEVFEKAFTGRSFSLQIPLNRNNLMLRLRGAGLSDPDLGAWRTAKEFEVDDDSINSLPVHQSSTDSAASNPDR